MGLVWNLIMLKRIIFFSLIIMLAACGKTQTGKSPKPQAKQSLTIFCTDHFRKSGLEATIVPDFSKKNNCTVNVVIFRNAAELAKAIKASENVGKFDIAIGVDNVFAASESLYTHFVTPESFNPDQLSKDAISDPGLRLLPYAYSNLCIIYNEKSITAPPQSFGELQDARYLSQIAVCDPHESGVGRASLFWSLALFGNDGYEHLWKSLRKNIYKSYPDRNEALEALKSGECSLLLSLNTIPAHLKEIDPASRSFGISMLKEGSYQYTENIGLHRGSVNHKTAEKFISYFLSQDAQKMVIYKLGMFPANKKTQLPMSFTSIPLTSYSVNSKLSQAQINDFLSSWLLFWDRLFGFQIS